MKKLVLVFTLLLWGMGAFAQTPIKLISYNIWNGFEWGKDKDREQKFIEWIKAQHPDVVAYQELCGYTDERLQKQAKAYGHAFSALLKTSGYSVGITSNKPINVNTKMQGMLWHGMLHCETYGVDFFILHLSPFDWKYRLNEADVILSYMTKQKNPYQLVMGDFNAHSPFDAERMEARTEFMEQAIQRDRNSKDNKNLMDEKQDYSVISRFLSYSLVDICQRHVASEKRYSYPTRVFEKEQKPELFRERLDYILTSPKMALKCTGADILNENGADYLSDHYPVMIEFIPVSDK